MDLEPQLAFRARGHREKEWFDGAGYTYAGYPVGSGGSAYLVLTSLGVSASCRDMGGAKALLEYCFSCEQESGLPANMDALRKEFAQYKARKPHRLVRQSGDDQRRGRGKIYGASKQRYRA